MKYLTIEQLEVGKLYLFRRAFNSKTIILQPGRLLEIQDSHIAGRKRPFVKFLLDGTEMGVSVGDGTKAAAPLTKSWLERQMNDRTAQVAALQAENSILFTAHKELT